MKNLLLWFISDVVQRGFGAWPAIFFIACDKVEHGCGNSLPETLLFRSLGWWWLGAKRCSFGAIIWIIWSGRCVDGRGTAKGPLRTLYGREASEALIHERLMNFREGYTSLKTVFDGDFRPHDESLNRIPHLWITLGVRRTNQVMLHH